MLGQGSWMTQQWKYRSIEIHHSPSILFVLVWPTPTSCLDCYNWLLMGFPASICAPPDQCQFRTTQWLFVFKIRSCRVSIINLFSTLPPPHQYSEKYLQWSIKPERGPRTLWSLQVAHMPLWKKVVSRVCDNICREVNWDKSLPHFWKISLQCCRLFLVFTFWCIIWNLADLQAQKPGNEFNSSLSRWW